jgi:hypothetical protein
MRTITDHQVNPANAKIKITVLDGPGPGNVSHSYLVSIETNNGVKEVPLEFQNGPIAEAGVNGITQEVLLSVVIDRLRGFQNGDYKCRENAIALTKIEEALMWLNSRTRSREQRGVEGTHKI